MQSTCLIALLLLAFGVAPVARAESTTWLVRPGDALSLIAERFGVTVTDLRTWNALDSDVIRQGQELVVRPPDAPPADESETRPSYLVAAGDTLSEIAVRFDVTTDELIEWNPGLDPQRVRAGRSLRVGTPRRQVTHEIRAGDTLSGLAAYYAVSVRDLLRWNDGLDPNRVRTGARVTVYTLREESRSESLGSPVAGSLAHAEALPPNPAYIIRDATRAFGTLETVRAIERGFVAVRAAHPNSPKVRVHDLSARDGGRLSDHRSHQSGRDADISYYQRQCPRGECPFRLIDPADLDVERQWTLLQAWIDADAVDAVFIDYKLQEALYEHARRQGANREQLQRWFQFPRGRTVPLGIVRHFPLHRDHLHVRFSCPDTDAECRGP